MEFSNYTNSIKSLKNFDTFEKPAKEYKEVGQFIVKKGQMVMTSVTKTEFSHLNDKDFILFMERKGQKIENYFWQEKDKLLTMELLL